MGSPFLLLTLVALGAVAGARPAAGAERAAVLVYAPRPQEPLWPRRPDLAARPSLAGAAQRAAGRAPIPAPQLAQELRQALAERKVVVLPGAIDEGLRAHEDRRTQPLVMQLGAARELLRAGQQRLAEVELEQADALLLEAERRCRELLLLPEMPRVLAEVLRWRGVVLFELRRRSEAQQLFRQALALAPGTVLTEADVRPEVALAFRRVAAELGPPVPLRVVPQFIPTSPTPAALRGVVSVSIDGVEVPVSQSRGAAEHTVPTGEHLVLVRAPGYLPQAERVEVAGEQQVYVVLRLDHTALALSGLRQAPSSAGLAALCATLSLSSVLLAAVGHDAGEDVVAGQRYHCAAGTSGAATLLRGGVGVRTLAEQLLRRLWQEAAVPVGPQEPDLLTLAPLRNPRSPPPPRVPFYARPWLWIGAAAVVSAVLLGVGLRPLPEPQSTLLVDPKSFALRF